MKIQEIVLNEKQLKKGQLKDTIKYENIQSINKGS